MKLGLCMIARNEAQSIVHTLESVRNFVTEIVIAIDPTTTDNTRDVVSDWLQGWDETGEKWSLVDGVSVEDVGFGPARSHALEHVKNSEWLLILDADEVFPERMVVDWPNPDGTHKPREFRPQPVLASVLSQIQPEVDLLAVNMVMLSNEGNVESMFQGERVIRKHVRFEGPMHNYCIHTTRGAHTPDEVAIFHNRQYRPEHERRQRGLQRLRIAEKHYPPLLEKNPEDTRSLFYLAGTYNDIGRYADAIRYYERYLDCANWEHERYQATVFYCRAILSSQQETPEERRTQLLRARETAIKYIADNWKRAELYCVAGDICYELERFAEALWWYETASRRPAQPDPHFVEGPTHTWLPKLRIAQTHFALGNLDAGNEALKEAQKCGAPHGALDEIHRTAVPLYKPIQKLAIFLDRNDRKFIEPLIERWKTRYQIALCDNEEDIQKVMNWGPDLAWFEWAGPLLVKATEMPHQCRMVTRVHGYEVHSQYDQKRTFLQAVNWSRVDHAIFVAQYLIDMALRQVPELRERTAIHLVPGGIDSKHWIVADGKQGNRIAMAGYINSKKNIPLALMVLRQARKKRPELELHIAGDIQDSREWQYIQQLLDEYHLREAVHFEPWQHDLNAWYADKDYYLSASREESLHYALAQAMAAGLKPVIHCWRSSRDFYPDEYIWRDIDDAVAMLQKRISRKQRQAYRTWISKHLSFEEMARDIDLILAHPTVCLAAAGSEPWRFEVGIAEVLNAMGFGPGTVNQADLLLCGPGTMGALGVPGRNGRPGKRILWHAEHIAGDSEHAVDRRTQLKEHIEKADIVVVSAPNMRSVAESLGAKRVECVYAGGARPTWRKYQSKPKSFDVGYYGVINERRQQILDKLNSALQASGKMAVQRIEEYDHVRLADFVHRCKIVVNLHIADEPNIESRVAEVLAAGTLLITERLSEGHPFPKHVFVECDTVDELTEFVAYYLEHDREREAIAERGCAWVWENMTLGHQVDRMLRTCGVRWLGLEEQSVAGAN